MTDPNDVPTKPLPVPSDAAPTEPLAPELIETAPIASPAAAVPRDRSWLAPLVIGIVLVVLVILAVAVLPRLLAGEAAPAPSSTPTVEAPTEEAPPPVEEPTEAPPVIPLPEPVEPEPLPTEEPTEEPVEPSPVPTP